MDYYTLGTLITMSAAHTMANKIVLSVEGFVSPAVFLRFFLSWQALWAAVSLSRIVLKAHHHPRCTDQLFRGVALILPLVTLQTYAASKALAELPISVFLSLQCAVPLIVWGIEAVQHVEKKSIQRGLSQLSIFIMAVFSVSSILIRLPPTQSAGASWMALHVLSFALVKFLEANTVNQCVKANPHLRDLIYHCSVLILLTSTSLVAGDYFHVFQAPHFTRTSFWIALVVSGITIAFVSAQTVTPFAASAARAFTSCLSLAVFGLPDDIPTVIIVWMVLLFLCILRLNWGPPAGRLSCTHDMFKTLVQRQNHSDCQFQAII